jgi:hypothetical protein
LAANWFAPDIPHSTNFMGLSHLQKLQAETHFHTYSPSGATPADAARNVDCGMFGGCNYHVAHAGRLAPPSSSSRKHDHSSNSNKMGHFWGHPGEVMNKKQYVSIAY